MDITALDKLMEAETPEDRKLIKKRIFVIGLKAFNHNQMIRDDSSIFSEHNTTIRNHNYPFWVKR